MQPLLRQTTFKYKRFNADRFTRFTEAGVVRVNDEIVLLSDNGETNRKTYRVDLSPGNLSMQKVRFPVMYDLERFQKNE